MIKAVVFDCFGVLMLPNIFGVYTKPNKELFQYIKRDIAPHFHTAVISNIASDRLVELMGEQNRQLFQTVTLSFEAGVSKPDPEIYQIALQRIGLKAEECVFIDDIQDYCDAAEGQGMQAIHFITTEQAVADLSRLIDKQG